MWERISVISTLWCVLVCGNNGILLVAKIPSNQLFLPKNSTLNWFDGKKLFDIEFHVFSSLLCDVMTRASIYSVYFENRFRFFSIPTFTNPSPNPIPEKLIKMIIFGSKFLWNVFRNYEITFLINYIIQFFIEIFWKSIKIPIFYIWQFMICSNFCPILVKNSPKLLLLGYQFPSLSDSVLIPNFGIEYPVPGSDSGRPRFKWPGITWQDIKKKVGEG